MFYESTERTNPIILPEFERYVQNMLLFREIRKVYELPLDIATLVITEFVAPFFKADRESLLIDMEYTNIVKERMHSKAGKSYTDDDGVLRYHTVRFNISPLLNDPLIDLDPRVNSIFGSVFYKFSKVLEFAVYYNFITPLKAAPVFDTCLLYDDDKAFSLIREYKLDAYCKNLEIYVTKRTTLLNNLVKWGPAELEVLELLLLYYVEKGGEESDAIIIEWFIVGAYKANIPNPFGRFEPIIVDDMRARMAQLYQRARSHEFKERRVRLIVDGR